MNPDEQYAYPPEHIGSMAGEWTAHQLNVSAAITGYGYPVSGDTLADISDAYPEQEAR